MAYGKIKADAIIYDNSGSDVEKTIATLAAPTPEGTAVKSTGEAGTTKFLRVDGDGTCSWQVPPDTNTQLSTEEVQDIIGAMVTGNTETGITVTYEDGDGTLDFVVGNAATATEATNVTAVANNSTDETVYPTFVDGATGTQGIETDTGLTYNPSTGLLSTAAVTTTGNVIVGGNLTVSGTTTTVNSTTLTVDDKNIELGSVDTPSDTTADGGGITLKGATDKTITWVDATDCWTFNQNVEVTSGFLKVLGTEGGAASFYLYADEGDDQADKWRLQTTTGGAFKIENYSTGSWVTGLSFDGSNNVTFGGSVTDSKGNVRSIPQNTQGSTYTLVAADAGKHILASGTVTIPNSVFAAGDAVTIVNNTSGDLTLTASVGTLYNTADAATGNRTLATRGMATILFASATVAYISGAGLS